MRICIILLFNDGDALMSRAGAFDNKNFMSVDVLSVSGINMRDVDGRLMCYEKIL